MINSELRIGNIVFYKNYSYSVIGIGLQKAVLDNGITVNIKALKGMKIIPDILTLLGFDDVTPLIIAGMGQKIYRRDGVVLVYYVVTG